MHEFAIARTDVKLSSAEYQMSMVGLTKCVQGAQPHWRGHGGHWGTCPLRAYLYLSIVNHRRAVTENSAKMHQNTSSAHKKNPQKILAKGYCPIFKTFPGWERRPISTP